MKKNTKTIYKIITVALFVVFLFWFGIYFPKNPFAKETIIYETKNGFGAGKIAADLRKQDIIKSNYFFRLYIVFSGNHFKIQAGKYAIGPNMSIAEIAEKFVNGDVVKEKITILEGWNLKNIQEYLAEKNICKKEKFFEIIKNDFSGKFIFLEDKPTNVGLEGYIFPDTYEILAQDSCENVIKKALLNFDKKLSEELRVEIIKQKKTIFGIITISSIIEKEVKTIEDKKMVAAVLNNRLDLGMPLQVDSTINYITGKNDPGALIIDTKIDSPYNTYKYAGLPRGPISNPGIDSIMAAIYPKENNYLYYLSTKEGKTIFSRTIDEHNAAKAKYLKL